MNSQAVVCLTVIVSLAGCAARGKYSQTRARTVDAGSRITMAAGSELVVRSVQTIDTADADERKVWPAVLARDVIGEGGEVLLSAGSPVMFGVNRDTNGVKLVIRSIMVNGNSYLTTTPVDASADAGRRLEPWGASTKAPESRTDGDRISVPAQVLLVVKLGAEMRLR